MKRFWGFIAKEFLHIFRDYRTMLVLFGMPVALVLLFGFVITDEVKDVKIVIYDKAKDHQSKQLITKILASPYFILHREINSDSHIEGVFKEGKAKVVVVFEAQFAENLMKTGTARIHLIADATDANTANLIVNYTKNIIVNYQSEINKNLQLPMRIVPEVRMRYNEAMRSVYMFVPGIMSMILMLVSALMTSVSIAREKELGTMEVLLVSPLHPVQIILGKVTPYLALSFVNVLTIIGLAYYVFDVPIEGSLTLLLFESLLFIFVALSLGMLISSITSSQQVAMMLSAMALMLPTILLSGFIFPISNMPVILQYITHIIPPKYYIIIVKNIMLKGTGIEHVWRETLILCGMVVFFMTLSIKKFKVRLEN